MPDVPIARQIACVKRELGMRRRVYPKRVADGRMTEADHQREVAEMEAVLATLEGVAKAARAAEDLFGGKA